MSTGDVTDILKAWSFSKNHFRVNGMPEGQKSVTSDILGLFSDQGGRLMVVDSSCVRVSVRRQADRAVAAWQAAEAGRS